MPDVGRFSQPFTSTLPIAAHQSLYAKDVESFLYWLNQEAQTHGWPAPNWQLHNGQALESFTPRNAAPFALTGTPSNVKQVWNQIRDYFAAVGPYLFQDFVDKNPFTGSAWDPSDKATIGQYGKIDIHHARSLINNMSANAPVWNSVSITKSTPGFGNTANGYQATATVAADGSFTDTVNSYDWNSLAASAINGAWSVFQNAPWQIGPATLGFGSEMTLQLEAFRAGPPYQFFATAGVFSAIQITYRWIGPHGLKQSVGMASLEDGTLPVAVTTQNGNPSPGVAWNPFGNSCVIAYGVIGLASTAGQADLVSAVLAALPGTTLYTVPEPPTTSMSGLPGYNTSTFTTRASANAADFSAAHEAVGGGWFWIAAFSKPAWASGAAPPTLPMIAGSSLTSNPVRGSLALGLALSSDASIWPLVFGTGYTVGPIFVRSQSSGALGTPSSFAG